MQYSYYRALLSMGSTDSPYRIPGEAVRVMCHLAVLLSVCMTLFCTPTFQLLAQDVQVRGVVSDRESGETLIFAHILVVENGNGVVTNREGEFRLYLLPGEWTLRVSFIGYQSETRRVRVTDTSLTVNVSLRPLTFEMPAVTVTPDDSLARLIVRRARQSRIERKKELHSYHMRAHNKAYSRIDSTKNMSERLTEYLTASMLQVTETQTEAWFQQPDRNKILVHGRRQTDLFSEMGGAIHSGFARMDLSREEITFGDNPGSIVGPISEKGLDGVYWYSVVGVSRGERKDIYRIRVLPKSSLRPALSGYYYIEDSTWSVMQVEIEFNRAARAVSLPIAELIRHRQQFSLYQGRHWLPSAGNILVQGKLTLMGSQVWLSLEASSVIAEYEINQPDIDTVFDGYRLEILPLADAISDSAWERGRLHPPSLVDAGIYQVADSMAALRAAEGMEYHFGHIISGKELRRDNLTWSVPGLIGMLRFNRVEGLSPGLPFESEDKEGTVRKYGVNLGYGMLDHRAKVSADLQLRLGRRHVSEITLRGWHDISPLFRDELLYGETVATVMALLDRYDGRDYFYRTGGDAQWSGFSFPWLETTLEAGWSKLQSAEKHTDWSLRGDGVYRDNPPVPEGNITSAAVTFRGDFRARMLDKGRVRRGGRNRTDFVPALSVDFLRMDLDNGQWEVWMPQLSVTGGFSFGIAGMTAFRSSWSKASDRLSLHSLLTLVGSEPALTSAFRFRTAGIGEFAGDERATLFLDHNFGTLPFQWLGLPEGQFFSFEMWELRLFVSAGWTRMRGTTAAMLADGPGEARRPLVEAGLSLAKIFGLLQMDFGHRMTHTGSGSDYFIGFSISP